MWTLNTYIIDVQEIFTNESGLNIQLAAATLVLYQYLWAATLELDLQISKLWLAYIDLIN